MLILHTIIKERRSANAKTNYDFNNNLYIAYWMLKIRSRTRFSTMPEKKEVNTVTEEAKSAVERMAEQKHVKPKLSDEFISEYLNMDDFDELKRRTKAGIAITNDTADMTKEEFLLWMDIVRSKWFNQYTVTDLEEKKKEFDRIIQEMAEEAGMSIRER